MEVKDRLAELRDKYEVPLSEQDTFQFLDDYQTKVEPDNVPLKLILDVILENYTIYYEQDYEHSVKNRAIKLDDWQYWFHKKQDLLFLMREMVRLIWRRENLYYTDPYGEEGAKKLLEDKYGT